MKPEWIAVDWGTSNLRVWAMGPDGVLAEASSDAGMGTLSREGFEPALLDQMDAAGVWQIVKNEPLLSYQTFVLYYGFDQSVRQIAGALHISEDAVKARLYRTRERIRMQWKGADEQ